MRKLILKKCGLDDPDQIDPALVVSGNLNEASASTLRLRPNQCRYPVGDPKGFFHYCRATREPPSMYCMRHMNRCYVIPPPRKV